MTLDEINREARAMGLTYGEYVARYLSNENHERVPSPLNARARKRRWTDAEAFEMWKDGKSDSDIGRAFGVSRQIIQRWRDTMELPSTATQEVDTSKYRMVQTMAGSFVVSATQENEESMYNDERRL